MKKKEEGGVAVARDEDVSLKQAALILKLSTSTVDDLVRRNSVLEVKGKVGRGGALRLNLPGLLLLDVAARLNFANVPRKSIREIVEKLKTRIDSDRSLAIIYGRDHADIMESATLDLATLSQSWSSALTVDYVTPRERLADIERTMSTEAPPARRGRPKSNPKWVEQKLNASADLGDDASSPDEIVAMIGERGTAPWREAHK